MKALNWVKTAIHCGVLLAIAGLVSWTSLQAQTATDPGNYFGVPPLDQFVRIVSPANHATFFTPVDLPIFAYAREELTPGAGVAAYTNVSFYYSGATAAGITFTNVLLGQAVCLNTTNPPTTLPLSPAVPRAEPRLAALYSWVWTNAPAGSYTLTAVARGTEFATGNGAAGLARTSAPVSITISASVTNSNPLDVVSVVAADPIAIAGTNVWWKWPGQTNGTPSWTNWPPAHWGYVTNWGPKNGLFALRRFGNVSTNLTVNYNLGGTASNGVDYVQLPGYVTFPPGKAYAIVPVVPLDNNLTNIAKSVILSLAVDTNTPPDYLLGIPRRAEVLIMDYWPRPVPILLSDGTFHLSDTNAPDGAWFSVQSSGDLKAWTTVSTNQVVHGSVDFLDPNAPGSPSGFYRYVPLTNTPAD